MSFFDQKSWMSSAKRSRPSGGRLFCILVVRPEIPVALLFSYAIDWCNNFIFHWGFSQFFHHVHWFDFVQHTQVSRNFSNENCCVVFLQTFQIVFLIHCNFSFFVFEILFTKWVVVALETFDDLEDHFPGITRVSLKILSLAFACEVSLPKCFCSLFFSL